MAKGELLASSKFFVDFDGLADLVVKKVSGISIELLTAGDQTPYGVTKGGKSQIQATVTGTQNGTITVEYVGTAGDKRLFQWFEQSHSQPTTGGGTQTKGKLKDGSIILYNQGGDEAARWNMKGVMPKSYKTTKMEAGSTELFIETVEFAMESLRRVK
ncbi:phage tail protein [Calothrix sp. 336/3]|uniref:phage tail protein n=1 Tax=Calothrix sp. 336/3 TaxID=1337936 RepID=UPI0004E430D1|nr:phage tail protein [Calothrix sp. 336/3]AKG20498.1 T4-like virus tail tube protein gp19 [Calothrix sp. 336/3]